MPRRAAGKRRKRTPRVLLARQAATRTADGLWSLLIEQEQGPYCKQWVIAQMPGTDAHHLITRQRRATRWDLANGAWLSRDGHNFVHEHKGRGMNDRLAVRLLGEAGWLALKARAVTDPPESPFSAVARLRQLVEQRGLVNLARERGLWED